MPTKERNKLRDPFTYGRIVRELNVEDYKPWLIAMSLRMPGNFTVRRKRDKGTVEVWSIFPEAVDEAIKKSLGECTTKVKKTKPVYTQGTGRIAALFSLPDEIAQQKKSEKWVPKVAGW